MELDYKKMYEDSLKMMQQMVLEGKVPKEIADMILPDVVEKSESDKMIDALVSGLIQYKGANGDYNFGGTDINKICNWLETLCLKRLNRPALHMDDKLCGLDRWCAERLSKIYYYDEVLRYLRR